LVPPSFTPHRNAECFGSLAVQNRFELHWLLDRKIGRLCAYSQNHGCAASANAE
jgi:hypothetical protein